MNLVLLRLFPLHIFRQSWRGNHKMWVDPPECFRLKTGTLYISSASKQNNVEGSNGEASQVFGMRRRHHCFVVTAQARSFLYHQVRLIVGTLKAVGTGDPTVPDVERILKARTVTTASAMALACGTKFSNS